MKTLEELILQEFVDSLSSKRSEKSFHKLLVKEDELTATLSDQQRKSYDNLTFLEGDCDLIEMKGLIVFVFKFIKQIKKI